MGAEFPVNFRIGAGWRVVALLLASAVFCVSFGSAVAGQTPKDCVTQQLTHVGSPPRDDTWRALKETVTEYAAASSEDVPEFSARTALEWCRTLGSNQPELRQYWPSQAPPLIFTDRDAQVDHAALQAADTRVRGFVEDAFDIALAGRFAMVAAQSDTALTRLVNKGLRAQGKRGGRLNTDVARFCNPRRVGGFAGRHFLALCWPPPIKGEARYDHLLRTGFLAVYAHEFMHMAQYELTGDIPAQRLSDGSDFLLGPAWMVEGAAEFLELQFVLGPIAIEGKALFNLQSSARRIRTPLRDLRQSGSVAGGRAYGTARFAAVLLAKKHGGRALFDYFSALGRTKDRAVAFEEVFGQSMASFEDEFETLRRDFGAAERYGAQQ